MVALITEAYCAHRDDPITFADTSWAMTLITLPDGDAALHGLYALIAARTLSVSSPMAYMVTLMADAHRDDHVQFADDLTLSTLPDSDAALHGVHALIAAKMRVQL